MKLTLLITGGASGLGQAMALKWAATGAIVCIVDRNELRGQETVQLINNIGGSGHFVACDISSDDDVARIKQYTDEHLPPVDLIINCAGVATAGSLTSETLKAWQWVIDINLLGMVRVSKLYIDDFVARRQGYFINVASQAGLTSAPLMGSYNATKAAVVALSETMKLELAPFNIGVSVLCPAFVKTNLDESLPEDQQNMQGAVTKLLDRATVTANEVAEITFNAVQKKKFLIVTHFEGKYTYWLKRWFPALYFALMKSKTKRFAERGYKHEPSQSH